MVTLAYVEKDDAVRKHFSTSINCWDECELISSKPSIIQLIEVPAESSLSQIVLLGLDQPTLGDILGIRVLKSRYPSIKVIGISLTVREGVVKRAVHFGASSYLGMEESDTVFIKTIKAVLKHDHCINSYAKKKYFTADVSSLDMAPMLADAEISEAEMKLLKILPTGLTYKQIADKCKLSIKTVHSHREKLFNKLNVTSRQELAVIAIESGLFRSTSEAL